VFNVTPQNLFVVQSSSRPSLQVYTTYCVPSYDVPQQ
jgi:hypothetical protein